MCSHRATSLQLTVSINTQICNGIVNATMPMMAMTLSSGEPDRLPLTAIFIAS